MKTLRTDAIILGRTDFGEADRIIKILTPERGKISVLAKAVRKNNSKLAGGIELFSVCDLNLHFGNGELATLTGARIKTFYGNIIADYDRMQFAYDILKEINCAAEMLAEPEFYHLTLSSLDALNKNLNLDLVKSWFYLHLANLLGNGLNTATDANGMNLVEGNNYNFNRNDQVFSFDKDGNFTTDHLKVLRLMAQNQPEIIARLSVSPQIYSDILEVAMGIAKL